MSNAYYINPVKIHDINGNPYVDDGNYFFFIKEPHAYLLIALRDYININKLSEHPVTANGLSLEDTAKYNISINVHRVIAGGPNTEVVNYLLFNNGSNKMNVIGVGDKLDLIVSGGNPRSLSYYTNIIETANSDIVDKYNGNLFDVKLAMVINEQAIKDITFDQAISNNGPFTTIINKLRERNNNLNKLIGSELLKISPVKEPTIQSGGKPIDTLNADALLLYAHTRGQYAYLKYLKYRTKYYNLLNKYSI